MVSETLMSASNSDQKDWEFRVLGRVLFQLPWRVVYTIILGLSIGVGLNSPHEVMNFADHAIQEAKHWRALISRTVEGILGAVAPSRTRPASRRKAPWGQRGGWSGRSGGGPHVEVDPPPPDVSEPDWPRGPWAGAACHVDAQKLRGDSLRLRDGPCGTSAHRRSVAGGTGDIRLTGRSAYCLSYEKWWTWSEIIYQDEVLWVARHYLRCPRWPAS